ncbi:MAG: PilZ domain-containing protein [Peptococcaceae bacterium]
MLKENEKRNFLRVSVNWQAETEAAQGIITLDIINISIGGLMFKTEESIALNTELTFSLPIGDLAAKVEWQKEDIYGASFINLSGPETAALVKEVYDRWRNKEIEPIR